MTALTFLSQGYKLELQVQSKLQQIADLRALATQVRSYSDQEPVSHTLDVTAMQSTIAKIVEEEEILNRFREQAEAGQVIIVADIKRAFDEKLGRDTGRGYIYMLLARHDWRKVMPRQKHPKKADDETIEASKKLKHV